MSLQLTPNGVQFKDTNGFLVEMGMQGGLLVTAPNGQARSFTGAKHLFDTADQAEKAEAREPMEMLEASLEFADRMASEFEGERRRLQTLRSRAASPVVDDSPMFVEDEQPMEVVDSMGMETMPEGGFPGSDGGSGCA